ncbi:MAG: maleylpyruvate isomerase family mycothiol-dependent enzyme [Candidatus Limnocylindrales bacterium]
MNIERDLVAIEYEGFRLIELGRQLPDRIVPQYPSWTLRDLVVHTAEVHGRTAAVCEELPSERISGPELPADVDPFEWAAEQLARMLHGLAMADPEAHVWTFVDDPSLGFWARRMVIETGVHRWDAHSAVGEPVELLSIVAGHGLDEFSDLYLPRLGTVQALEMSATDLDRSWRFGQGEPPAHVAGTASDLFLRLMSRPGVDLPGDWARAVDALGSPAER